MCTMKSSFLLIIFLSVVTMSCGTKPSTNKDSLKVVTTNEDKAAMPVLEKSKVVEIDNSADFIPDNYIQFDKTLGDLNKDGLDDCVLIIKKTDKAAIEKDDEGKEIDRNRRGIVILISNGKQYEKCLENLDCFSSENEDGGGYYAPELYIDIQKGNLFIGYAHGRYGYWTHTFRKKENDFELIGYDASENRGPIVMHEISINYLTGKKIEKTNTNEEAEEEGQEKFKSSTTKLKSSKPYYLSAIKDFDSFSAPIE